jgi:tripartite ATP-independent transporter DctM subunit
MLGATLVPEMEKRGYQKPMSLGPIMGSGCLAIMIPPSGMAVIMCSLGQFSVGKTLIAIIVPGLLMAFSYAVYIILRCWRQPHLAPVYAVPPLPLSEKIVAAVRYILPLAFVVLAVTGVIFLGIATPTEAAATGTAATFVLAAAYKALNWNLLKKATLASLQVTIMVFTIISGAMAFAQILAYTGATARLSELAISLPVPPICVVIIMQIVVLILGCFMDVVAIMMICLPIFMPVITQLGFDPVWFGTMFLLNIETAMITPPFGISLFVMKGVASPDTTMKDIYLGGLPFVYLNLLVMALILFIPPIALWLPSAMR